MIDGRLAGGDRGGTGRGGDAEIAHRHLHGRGGENANPLFVAETFTVVVPNGHASDPPGDVPHPPVHFNCVIAHWSGSEKPRAAGVMTAPAGEFPATTSARRAMKRRQGVLNGDERVGQTGAEHRIGHRRAQRRRAADNEPAQCGAGGDDVERPCGAGLQARRGLKEQRRFAGHVRAGRRRAEERILETSGRR